jgi:hypothetical protein
MNATPGLEIRKLQRIMALRLQVGSITSVAKNKTTPFNPSEKYESQLG